MTRNGVLMPRHSSELPGSPVLSVVVPAYKESGNVEQLYQQLSGALSPLGLSWELIVVDDGSPDGTWDRIVELHDRDARVKGLRLSRNFGHQYALGRPTTPAIAPLFRSPFGRLRAPSGPPEAGSVVLPAKTGHLS